MAFLRRTYPEILNNLLTDLAGGIAAEEHPFPPPTPAAAEGSAAPRPGELPVHLLQRPPVGRIVSVFGQRDGEPRHFAAGTDYALRADRQALEWREGATLPDPGTLVYISYLRMDTVEPPVTDLEVGSVLRTVMESAGLELGRLYAQLDAVRKSAYIDTATGTELDNVVSLLDVRRVRAGRASGEVRFTRSEGTRGAITIPAGTRIITTDGGVEYETTATVTLLDGQTVIRVPVRDLEPNDPLPAESLTVLPVPLAGIRSVSNPEPTALSARDETDDELRTRARNFLHGSERATLGAIRHALATQQVQGEVAEPPDRPGVVTITLHTEALSPEMDIRLRRAVEVARPAGVRVEWLGITPPMRVELALFLETRQGLTEPDLRAAQNAVRGKVQEYFSRLPARDPGSINQLVGLVLSVPQVQDVRIVSATVRPPEGGPPVDVLDRAGGTLATGGFTTVLGDLRITDPALPTLLSLVVLYPPDAAELPDPPTLRATLANLLAELNTLNAVPEAPEARRTLSYAKLRRLLPLPGRPGASLASLDDGTTALDDAEPETAALCTTRFVVTAQSGLSRILGKETDPPYVLAPLERLSLQTLTVEPDQNA